MNPKFSVGEVVILQSVNCPQFNGEQTVLIVSADKDDYKDPHYGYIISGKTGSGFAYIMDDPRLSKIYSEGYKRSILFAESALRKKHEPGNESFREMMDKLKVGATA